jgi:ATP-binding cassette subfamily B protein
VRDLPRHLAGAAALTWRAARWAVLLHLPLAVLAGLVPVGVAWLSRLIVGRLADDAAGAWPALLPAAVATAGLGLAGAALPNCQRYLHGRTTRAVAVVAMDRLYHGTARIVGLGRLEDPAFRDRLSLAQQAGRGWPAHLVDDAVSAVQSVITLAGFVGALIALDPWLAGSVIAAAGPAVAIQVRLNRARAAMMWRITPHNRRETHYAELLASIPAAKELRLFGLTGMFRVRMIAEMSAANAAQERQDRRELRSYAGLGMLSAAVAGIGLAWAVAGVAGGRLGVGDLTVFVAAVPGTQGALQSLIQRLATAHQAAIMFDHYVHVVDGPPDLPVPSRPRPLAPLRSGIELRDVWFRYAEDGPWILRGVNLFIPYGRAVALVGHNGAGKSTLIKLLCRFYDPVRGTIRWDGVDLRDIAVAELRARIGAVFQDYMAYDLSVAENIGVGDITQLNDRAKVVAAARRAGVHHTLAALPRGYDTQLSKMFFSETDKADPETGVLLSGGQWQRVALARALLRDRRDLMILDEPSSGLDAEAEHQVHTSLRAHRRGATSILISHRLGAVRDADEIVVLAGGEVVERGTHRDLLAAAGVYAHLFDLQAAGYRDTEAAAR